MAINFLVVEDNFIIQMFIEEIILECGHHVVAITSDGMEAFTLLETNDVDVLLLDIGLSGALSGIELATLVREKVGTPYVYLTGNSDWVTINKVKATQPLHIIHKPIDSCTFKLQLDVIQQKLTAPKKSPATVNKAGQ